MKCDDCRHFRFGTSGFGCDLSEKRVPLFRAKWDESVAELMEDCPLEKKE